MQRVLEPEWLDELSPADPRAVGSRRDLRRVNWWMGHVGIMHRVLARIEQDDRVGDARDSLLDRRSPQRLVELGAGDGTFLLRLARQRARHWPQGAVVLVDRQPAVGYDTEKAFTTLGWETETIAIDVFDWLTRPVGRPADLMIANLFLHHFREEQLRELFRLAADRTRVFLACEPRRSALALQASRLLGWIGCNDVTRHDAVISVRAGFAGRELSSLWPERERWHLQEEAGGLFSHCFVAQRR